MTKYNHHVPLSMAALIIIRYALSNYGSSYEKLILYYCELPKAENAFLICETWRFARCTSLCFSLGWKEDIIWYICNIFFLSVVCLESFDQLEKDLNEGRTVSQLLARSLARQAGRRRYMQKEKHSMIHWKSVRVPTIDVNKHGWRTRLATVQSVCVASARSFNFQ